MAKARFGLPRRHVKFASQWRRAYPDATLWACPGLMAREPEAGYNRELGPADTAPPEWLGEVEALCLTYERNPFNGKPFFNEVALSPSASSRLDGSSTHAFCQEAMRKCLPGAQLQVVFLHKPSGYLLTSDLFWNYPPAGTAFGTRLWKFGMDKVYLPFYRRFMIKDPGASRARPSGCRGAWSGLTQACCQRRGLPGGDPPAV